MTDFNEPDPVGQIHAKRLRQGESTKEAQRLPQLAIGLSAGALFFLFALSIMRRGHLNEDAYILFQYSKHLAEGRGIHFDHLSGPTEGATDFLWMASLAFQSFLGMDIGISAALLNALGLGVCLYALHQMRGRVDWVFCLCAAAIAISGGTSASLGGFSALAYGGVFSLLILTAVEKSYGWACFWGTVVALFRPDGVILSAGTTIGIVVLARRDDRILLLKLTIAMSIVGACYFLWRYSYFGQLLPLPLLVKQQTDTPFEGFNKNINALIGYRYCIIVALSLWLSRRKTFDWATTIPIVLGPTLLFVALSTAHQSQNIGARFQFPIILALLFFLQRAFPFNPKKWWIAALTLAIAVPIYRGARTISGSIKQLTGDDYSNTFPQLLRKHDFKVNSIALTEAGRFPYWYDAPRMIDLVGLNSKEVVEHGAPRVLEKHQPELIFIHHAGRFKFPVSHDPFVAVPIEDIQIKSYAGKNPVALAPAAALNFARRHGYRAYFAKNSEPNVNYWHVYFLAPTLDEKRFMKILRESVDTRMSYLHSAQDS